MVPGLKRVSGVKRRAYSFKYENRVDCDRWTAARRRIQSGHHLFTADGLVSVLRFNPGFYITISLYGPGSCFLITEATT